MRKGINENVQSGATSSKEGNMYVLGEMRGKMAWKIFKIS